MLKNPIISTTDTFGILGVILAMTRGINTQTQWAKDIPRWITTNTDFMDEIEDTPDSISPTWVRRNVFRIASDLRVTRQTNGFAVLATEIEAFFK